MVADRRIRKQRRWLLVSGAAALAVACEIVPRPRRTPEPEPAATPQLEHTVIRPVPDAVRLGAALPLSGPLADAGAAIKAGYELAVQQVNEAGGLALSDYERPVPVRLVVYDDQGHAGSSGLLAERLADYDRVDAFLGGFGSAAATRATVADAREIPYVTGTENESELSRGRRHVFGLRASESRLAAVQLAWLSWCQDRELLPRPARAALLWEDHPVGETYQLDVRVRTQAEKRAETAPDGLDIVYAEAFRTDGAADYRGLVRDIRDAEPDVILARAPLEDAILLQRQVSALRVEPRVVSYGFHGNQLAVRAQLGRAADRLVSATWWSPSLANTDSRALVARFTATHGHEPRWEHALAYGAAMVLLKAIARAGTVDTMRVRDVLAEQGDPASILPGGAVTFGPSRRADLPLLVVQNLPNAPEAIVWPPELKTAEPAMPPRA